ncbi:MAG: MBL fold metallo-hydrolase [Candidatus Limnocylindrales bacterium]
MARRPPSTAGPVVMPVPAATVILVRAAGDGIEVLLTERPVTMAFAAGAMVFPGGRVDAADADERLAAHSTRSAAAASAALGGGIDGSVALAAHHAAIRELFEEAGVLLASPAGGDPTSPSTASPNTASRLPTAGLEAARTGLLDRTLTLWDVVERLDLRLESASLVPIARWVTPAAYARRFDAWFFAAELPAGVEVRIAEREVTSHRWLRPTDALEAMADGRLSLWIPTSATLQRLGRVRSFAEVRATLAAGPAAPLRVERPAVDRIEILGTTAGGAPGSIVRTTVVGRRDLTVIDPGDPSSEALAAILAAAGELGGTIAAIVITSPDPERAAGADELAERTAAPVFAPAGAQRVLPFPVTELPDGAPIPRGDAGLRMGDLNPR